MKLLLDLFISTSGAKALLIDEKGSVVSSVTAPSHHDRAFQEYHPLWKALHLALAAGILSRG
jgi:sugar (pentulose or hexulose) kinase